MKSPEPQITAAAIAELLTQLRQGSASGATSSETNAALRRVMEIYCVVKAGGVQVQQEAAQAHLTRETANIKAAIAALQGQGADQQITSLRQELADLEQTVHWRLTLLQAIHPDEERVVSQYLSSLEAEFQQPSKPDSRP